MRGVEAQWVAAKKDWEQTKKKDKEKNKHGAETHQDDNLEDKLRDAMHDTERKEDPDAEYLPEMDPLRCMLYIHGGGYFFGSTDQQRYTIERYAR